MSLSQGTNFPAVGGPGFEHQGLTSWWSDVGFWVLCEQSLDGPRLASKIEAFAAAPPQAWRQHLKTVHLWASPNPQDSEWQKKYPNFVRSAATAGAGVMHFWGLSEFEAAHVQEGVFAHEMGHVIGGVPQPGADSITWEQACLLDTLQTANYWKQRAGLSWDAQLGARGYGTPSFGEAQAQLKPFEPHAVSLSIYGLNSEVEDWAEACKFWIFDHRYGTLGLWTDLSGTHHLRFSILFERRNDLIMDHRPTTSEAGAAASAPTEPPPVQVDLALPPVVAPTPLSDLTREQVLGALLGAAQRIAQMIAATEEAEGQAAAARLANRLADKADANDPLRSRLQQYGQGSLAAADIAVPQDEYGAFLDS